MPCFLGLRRIFEGVGPYLLGFKAHIFQGLGSLLKVQAHPTFAHCQ